MQIATSMEVLVQPSSCIMALCASYHIAKYIICIIQTHCVIETGCSSKQCKLCAVDAEMAWQWSHDVHHSPEALGLRLQQRLSDSYVIAISACYMFPHC